MSTLSKVAALVGIISGVVGTAATLKRMICPCDGTRLGIINNRYCQTCGHQH